MKKVSIVLLILILTVCILPVNTNAKTLSQLEDEVNKFTAELDSKNSQLIFSGYFKLLQGKN